MAEQIQTQMVNEKQRQVQLNDLKFKVQQDFLNMIGMASDVQATIDFFENDKENDMIKVQFNRLINQFNLSNAIHFDINYQSQNNNLNQYLNNEKQKMKMFLEQYLDQFDPQIQKYLLKYQQNSLSQNPVIQLEDHQKINYEAKFDSNVVQKVIQGQQEIDKVMRDINNGKKIEELQQSKIEKHKKYRYENATKKLERNFGNQNDINQMKEIQIENEEIKEQGCCQIF